MLDFLLSVLIGTICIVSISSLTLFIYGIIKVRRFFKGK